MQFLNSRVDNLLNKIDTYDKKNWEIIYQNYKLKNCADAVKLPKNRRRRLLDIDLFRGKPFQKAKPIYNFYSVTLIGLFRTLFFPLNSKWWKNHFEDYSFFLFLIIYILELLSILLYLLYKEINKNLEFFEATTHIITTFLISQLYIHMIAKNLTRPHSEVKEEKLLRYSSLDDLSFKKKESKTSLHRRKTKKIMNKLDFDSANDEEGPSLKKPEIYTDFNPDSVNEIFGSHLSDFDSGSDVSESSFSVIPSTLKDDYKVCSDSPSLKESCMMNFRGHVQEEVVVTYFSGKNMKNTKISIWEIVDLIKDRVRDETNFNKYGVNYTFYLILSLYFALLPTLHRVFMNILNDKTTELRLISKIIMHLWSWYSKNSSIMITEVMIISFIKFIMVMSFFVIILAAEKTFKIRIMFAKYFCALTSSRRARRRRLPHFRLNKVKNIKAWLSLRSYLRRCGPIKSVDIVVSAVLILSSIFILYVCLKYLIDLNMQKSDIGMVGNYHSWEILSWSIVLTSFLLRFLSFYKELNRRYNNNTELLTEQINLYLQLEVNPEQKNDYSIANNVLKLASKLIKEIESPQKFTGIIMNPIIRNIFRVVILSLISGVLSEVFGISFKFWKIKT